MGEEPKRYPDDAPWKQEEWLLREYHGKERSVRDIAEEFDVDRKTVQYWMDKHEIQVRDRQEAVRLAIGVPYASYGMDVDGHMRWQTSLRGDPIAAKVHQLLAIAEGADPYEIFGGKEVHHADAIPWDNRPENIEVLTAEEHRAISHFRHLSPESKEKVIELAEDHLTLGQFEVDESDD